MDPLTTRTAASTVAWAVTRSTGRAGSDSRSGELQPVHTGHLQVSDEHVEPGAGGELEGAFKKPGYSGAYWAGPSTEPRLESSTLSINALADQTELLALGCHLSRGGLDSRCYRITCGQWNWSPRG